jgi:hypothetical protein
MKAFRYFLLISVTAVCCLRADPAAQSPSDEYRLKAAFVSRFPQFVEWPEAAIGGSPALELCVLQPNPFGSDLESLVSGESVNGRPLRVRLVAGVGGLPGCHALFVGARSDTAGVLKAAVGRPILTVGETDKFLQGGGIIVLRVVDRRIRFEVDASNADKAGLRISSQLLALATAVRGGQR